MHVLPACRLPPTTNKQAAAHHMRADGTTYHIVEYNPVTAEVNTKFTYQVLGKLKDEIYTSCAAVYS